MCELTLSKIRQIAKPKKFLGQNFLIDQNIARKIVGLIDPNGHIIEVGPGFGSLSFHLAKLPAKSVDIIEIDSDCVNWLQSSILSQNKIFNIIHADALRFDYNAIAGEHGSKVSVISNLPYNIGTKLVILWLTKYRPIIAEIVIMLQKEVIDRMMAAHGSKDYGSLSVLCQYSADIHHCFDVTPSCFYPAPSVDSSVVKITLSAAYNVDIAHDLERLVSVLFQHRRKKIGSVIRKYAREFEGITLDMDKRPEEIGVQEYVLAISDRSTL